MIVVTPYDTSHNWSTFPYMIKLDEYMKCEFFCIHTLKHPQKRYKLKHW